MASYYTSDSLIEAVKSTAAIPISQSTFTENDILRFANEELDATIVPLIMEMHEDFFLYSDTTSLVADTRTYDIPYRAMGNKLRDVAYKDANSYTYEMFRIPVDRLSDYRAGDNVSSDPYEYYIKNNQINLIYNPSDTSGSLEFFYYLRPNKLVQNSAAAVITAIDTDTSTVTVSSLPTTITSSTPVDFIQQRSPHRLLAFDQTPTITNSTLKTITFSSLPTGLRVGDHVALAEQCIIPQIPSEAHPLLVERVVYRVMEAQSDVQGMQVAASRIKEMENKAGRIFDNRVEGSPQKIVNRNGFMTYNSRRRRRGTR